jgi:hypothetical protein
MYHDGELEIQRRAGVADMAARVGRIISNTIPPAAVRFIEHQTLLVASSIDRDGRVWASPIHAGARVIDERTLRIASDLAIDDPRIGLLAIDMETRRRMRVNGRATRDGRDIVIATDEVYSNCPQYIHPRPAKPDMSSPESWVSTSDTFFLATAHPARGADASHRGGDPGFVTFDGTRLSFPDYPGNNMFNSLGNLQVDPRCGLLFLDFESGAGLQISGRGRIEWDPLRRVEIEADVVRFC